MSTVNIEYKLSENPGKIYWLGFALTPFIVLLTCLAYVYSNLYVNFVGLNVLFLIIFCVFLFYINKLIVRISSCRSKKASMIHASYMAVVTVYLLFATYVYSMFRIDNVNYSLIDLIIKPVMMFERVGFIAQMGPYNVFGGKISGIYFWLYTFVELVIIIGSVYFGGKKGVHEAVYCEQCKRWAEDVKLDLKLDVMNEKEVTNILNSDLDKLLDLNKFNSKNSNHIVVNIHKCSKCNETCTLDVDMVSYTKDKKGNFQEAKNDFSPLYLINQDQYQKFVSKKAQG
jgi:hypothetical protein